MSHLKDLRGRKFGRLTVIERDLSPQKTNRIRTKWLCKCDCGNICSVVSTDLLNGHTNSCGCYHKDQARKSLINIKSRNPNFHSTKCKAYRIWSGMMRRCYSPKNKYYKYYGGRGIKVCDRWHDYHKFHTDMGDPKKEDTIDRVDGNGDYSPENCCWATMKIQNSHRNSCHIIVYNNKQYCLKWFAEEYGLIYSRVLSLYHKGLSPEQIIETCKDKYIRKYSINLFD